MSAAAHAAADAGTRSERIAELRAKLAARQGKPGFKRNTQAIRAEIARLHTLEGGAA